MKLKSFSWQKTKIFHVYARWCFDLNLVDTSSLVGKQICDAIDAPFERRRILFFGENQNSRMRFVELLKVERSRLQMIRIVQMVVVPICLKLLMQLLK